jgi:hypothetical protein
MPSDWYVVIDGNSCGPFDDVRIKALAQEGRITPETLVSRAGMQQWVPALKIRGLFGATQATKTRPQAAQSKPTSPFRPAPRQPAAPQAEAPSFPAVQIRTPPSRFRYTAKPDFSLNIMLGLGGAAAMLLGFFCPIMRLPIIGSMSYLSFTGLLVREGAVSEMTISAFLVLAAVGVVSRRLKPASDRRMTSGHLHGAFRPTGLPAAQPRKEACYGECTEDDDDRGDSITTIGRTVLS